MHHCSLYVNCVCHAIDLSRLIVTWINVIHQHYIFNFILFLHPKKVEGDINHFAWKLKLKLSPGWWSKNCSQCLHLIVSWMICSNCTNMQVFFLKDVIKSDIFRYEIHYALTRISDNCCQKKKREEWNVSWSSEETKYLIITLSSHLIADFVMDVN